MIDKVELSDGTNAVRHQFDKKALFIGDSMMVTLEAMGDAQISAAVTKISAAADENGEFAVTLTLDETEGVYIGMTATAKK